MVREAVLADQEAVYRLMCDLEGEEIPRQGFDAAWAAQRASGAHTHLVWEEGGQVLGFLNLRVEGQLHHGGMVAEVMELVTSPGSCGRGVGKALLESALETAKGKGCLTMDVTSNRAREGAHRFYLREGFSQTHVKFTRDL